MKTILRCNILILLVVLAVVIAQEQPQKRAVDDEGTGIQLADSIIEKDKAERQSQRPRRIVKKPLGFFGTIGTIGRLIYEQYNDTKSAFGQVSELLNNQFSDTARPTKRPRVTDNSTTTTEAPPKLSRAEFYDILRRNVIGLRRLYNLEMREALADSRKNIQDYKREFNRKLYEQFRDD